MVCVFFKIQQRNNISLQKDKDCAITSERLNKNYYQI